MKKTIILFLCLVSVMLCHAQIEISTSQLAGKKWKKISPVQKNQSLTMMFTETHFKEQIYYSLLNKTSYGSLNYYITDELPSYNEFHMDYVGKERKGQYIVMYYPKVNDVDYFTVVSFTDEELVLFHKAVPNTIPGLNVYIKYERIK